MDELLHVLESGKVYLSLTKLDLPGEEYRHLTLRFICLESYRYDQEGLNRYATILDNYSVVQGSWFDTLNDLVAIEGLEEIKARLKQTKVDGLRFRRTCLSLDFEGLGNRDTYELRVYAYFKQVKPNTLNGRHTVLLKYGILEEWNFSSDSNDVFDEEVFYLCRDFKNNKEPCT